MKDEPLEKPVVDGFFGDTLDGFGLDAGEKTSGPVGDGEAAAVDAVDDVAPAVIQAQISAAIAAAASAGAIAIEVGDELGEFILADERLVRRRDEAGVGIDAQHLTDRLGGGVLDQPAWQTRPAGFVGLVSAVFLPLREGRLVVFHGL